MAGAAYLGRNGFSPGGISYYGQYNCQNKKDYGELNVFVPESYVQAHFSPSTYCFLRLAEYINSFFYANSNSNPFRT